MLATGNFSEFQSAYRVGHSTETALLKVVNDIVTAACDQQSIVLLSLGMSAAFDTIDHTIVLIVISASMAPLSAGSSRLCLTGNSTSL